MCWAFLTSASTFLSIFGWMRGWWWLLQSWWHGSSGGGSGPLRTRCGAALLISKIPLGVFAVTNSAFGIVQSPTTHIQYFKMNQHRSRSKIYTALERSKEFLLNLQYLKNIRTFFWITFSLFYVQKIFHVIQLTFICCSDGTKNRTIREEFWALERRKPLTRL